MANSTIDIGDEFRERRHPRRLWRVVDRTEERYQIVCVEEPNLVRFPGADALLDERRYERRQDRP
jgi:hypothetical protein